MSCAASCTCLCMMQGRKHTYTQSSANWTSDRLSFFLPSRSYFCLLLPAAFPVDRDTRGCCTNLVDKRGVQMFWLKVRMAKSELEALLPMLPNVCLLKRKRININKQLTDVCAGSVWRLCSPFMPPYYSLCLVRDVWSFFSTFSKSWAHKWQIKKKAMSNGWD